MHHLGKIYLAGHTGMVGSSIFRLLRHLGYDSDSLLTESKSRLNLTSQNLVNDFFSARKPATVILAAAKVGGIYANRNFPYDFLSQNLIIQSNIFQACLDNGVRNICFLGSSCMYPVSSSQPYCEEDLLTGSFEQTNEAFALAKITGLKTCQYLRNQFGLNTFTVIPNNSYGPNDHYTKDRGHVIPSIIQKIRSAVINQDPYIKCWGTGMPLRNFIYVDDLAHAIFKLIQSQTTDSKHNIYNIGSAKEITILDLVQLIAQKLNYKGEIIWDDTQPDGMLRKALDTQRIATLGISLSTPLDLGLNLSLKDFNSRYPIN